MSDIYEKHQIIARAIEKKSDKEKSTNDRKHTDKCKDLLVRYPGE